MSFEISISTQSFGDNFFSSSVSYSLSEPEISLSTQLFGDKVLSSSVSYSLGEPEISLSTQSLQVRYLHILLVLW